MLSEAHVFFLPSTQRVIALNNEKIALAISKHTPNNQEYMHSIASQLLIQIVIYQLFRKPFNHFL